MLTALVFTRTLTVREGMLENDLQEILSRGRSGGDGHLRHCFSVGWITAYFPGKRRQATLA